MSSTLYLLDTNILVHAIRDDDTWQRIRANYNLLMHQPTPLISVVTDGEIRSLAYQWGWGDNRRNQMSFLVGYFSRVTIDDPDILEAYALIDDFSRTTGYSMGKNDLWRAATAKVLDATLLTTDSDFDHLVGVALAVEHP